MSFFCFLMGDAVALLGNHDLHLLAVAEGVRPEHRSDTLNQILTDPARDRWIDWLRRRRLADSVHGWLLVHAGVPPQWDVATTRALAGEVEALLAGPDLPAFLRRMYGNQPDRWSDDLVEADRWRFVVNALTRMRFCTADGTLDFATKEGADAAPPGHWPWFEVPGRRTAGTPIAFGHWSTLGLRNQTDLLAIDTGCVWGGAALLAQPELLLLDEPTTGVDPVSRREFWLLLNRLHHEGLTIVVSTPYMDEAEYASRIGFLDAWRHVSLGTRTAILASYSRALAEVRTVDRLAVRARLSGLPAVDDVSLFGTRLHVRGREGVSGDRLLDVVQAALDGLVAPDDVEAIEPSIEDVFVLSSEGVAP